MGFSTDVNLPRSHRAQFPDRCAVCGCAGPGATVRLITGSIGWWTWITLFWGMPFIVNAPACRHCGWRLQGLRSLSFLVTVAIAAFAIFVIWPHVEGLVARPIRRWVAVGLGLICLLPQILFEVFFPRSFELTVYKDSVDYEFSSQKYAIEFAMANFDAEWVKVEGVDLK